MSAKTAMMVLLASLFVTAGLLGCAPTTAPDAGAPTGDTTGDTTSDTSGDTTGDTANDPASEETRIAILNVTAEAQQLSGTNPAWIPDLPTPTYIPTPIGRVVPDEFPTATPVPTGPAVLRYDGLYSAKMDETPRGWYYLRFYPDGTVISTISYGDPMDVATWFTQGANHTGTGTYTLEDHRLVFSTQRNDNDHIKEWEGDVQGEVLEMEVYAFATGIRWPLRYRFAAVTVIDPPQITDTPAP